MLKSQIRISCRRESIPISVRQKIRKLARINGKDPYEMAGILLFNSVTDKDSKIKVKKK